jgi:RNA-directed DNA polymerase
MLLEPIYEQEFMECSFGFRPGRSAHDALQYLWKQCSQSTAEQGKGVFDFLGFTHYWGKTRKGGYAVKRKTAAKRMSRGLKAISQWMQSQLHWPIRDQWEKLVQKLNGHFAYYGITGNAEALERFRDAAKRLWHKWLNRRSRQSGGMSWQRFEELLKQFYPLPPPRVVHSIYAAKS